MLSFVSSGVDLALPGGHLHLHRGLGDTRVYIRRQYTFLIVACLVAAHTIFYSTSVLLTSLPDSTRRDLRATGSHPSGSPIASQPSNQQQGTFTACNAIASPYSLRLYGEDTLPKLAHFTRANVLLLEDVHPGSYWTIQRDPSGPNGTESNVVEWATRGDSPLAPLPPGMLPLFSRAPHSTACSLAQVRHQWQVAHGPPQAAQQTQQQTQRQTQRQTQQQTQRQTQRQTQQQTQQQSQLLLIRSDLEAELLRGATAGLGHPQGMFFRVSLPYGLKPEMDGGGGSGGGGGDAVNRARSSGSDGDGGDGSGAEGGEASGSQAGGKDEGVDTSGGSVMFAEQVLFEADDSFARGARLFPIRSMTKALVALLCLALQDRGLLSVSDPVHKHLPAWSRGPQAEMTVGMLLSHTAGYDNAYHDDHVLAPGNITLLESAHRTLTRTKLTSKPGTQFWYSEIGYQVLGAVIEAATNRTFHSLLEELVLVPAGMCHTRVINWWTDVVPTRGPLIPNCLSHDPDPDPHNDGDPADPWVSALGGAVAGGSDGGASDSAGGNSRSHHRDHGRSEQGPAAGGLPPHFRRQLQQHPQQTRRQKRHHRRRTRLAGGGDVQDEGAVPAGAASATSPSRNDGFGGGSRGFAHQHPAISTAGRWSTNPSIALGGISSANDLGRLLGLLANGGRAACCRTPDAAGSEWGIRGVREAAGASRSVSSDSSLAAHGELGSGTGVPGGRASRRRTSGGHRRSLGLGIGGAGGAGSGGDGGHGNGNGDGVGDNAIVEKHGRGRYRCGARVVSEVGIATMLSRKPTPGLSSSPLVRSISDAVPLTAQLMTRMGLLDAAAYDTWRRELWSDFGYGYGVWLSRGQAVGEAERDHVWLFGAFNTLAALVTVGPNSTAATAASRLDRARALGDQQQQQHGVRLAVVGASLSGFNGVWAVTAGYLAAQE